MVKPIKQREKKKHHVIFQVNPNDKLAIFDQFSRFDFQIQLIEKGGRTYLDFLCPYTMHFARGALL